MTVKAPTFADVRREGDKIGAALSGKHRSIPALQTKIS
jgi:hypothetical protein